MEKEKVVVLFILHNRLDLMTSVLGIYGMGVGVGVRLAAVIYGIWGELLTQTQPQ